MYRHGCWRRHSQNHIWICPYSGFCKLRKAGHFAICPMLIEFIIDVPAISEIAKTFDYCIELWSCRFEQTRHQGGQ